MLRVRTALLALSFLAASVSQTRLHAATPDVPEAVREAMQDRDYLGAVKAIDEAVKTAKEGKDYLAYLKARALHLAEKYDEAIVRFDTIEKEFPGSPWARRARFGMAVSLARKGDFRAAEVIYKREAQYLLSADRKQEIADLYLEFAQTYFKPPKEEQKPDYQKALDFFQKALAVGPKPEKKIEVELLVAQCYQNLNNFAQAATLYAKFIKDYPDAPQLIEAKFRLGESQLAQNQAAEARRTWQDLLAAHADAKNERLPEAAYQLAKTYGIPQPGSDEDLNLGVAALESFAQKYPDHKWAGKAYVRIAQSYMHRGRHDDAAKRLTAFLADTRYATREEIPEARHMLGQANLLQKKFTEAVAIWTEFLAKHPTHQSWSAVQQAILDAQYAMAEDRRQAKQYDEARKLWTEFLQKYPLDGRAAAILFQFGQMAFDQQKWDEAIAEWTRLASKYPQTSEASYAQYMIGVTLEEKQNKLEDALKQYRKVQGAYTGQAAQRVSQLTAKTMTIASERIFRTDETPKLKLTTRNIDAVTVRVYLIDLETYFRKMHLTGGVEGLDISLIDPDRSTEFKVPSYAEYQQLEREIEVPFPGAKQQGTGGAMAVTVSSKTLTATTLLLMSNLDIVVKSSRNECFVFAQNMLSGKPWPKARLLISNGQQVFAEGTTGDDGVFQKEFKELASANDVRVFAVADSHIASNIVGLQGIGVAQGLTEKGYIYTDRPAYKAGDLVHVRGVIRGVTGDGYTVEAGTKFQVQVLDPRNRLLHEQEVTLSTMGSFGTHFLMPEAAVQGQYRITVTDAARDRANPRSFNGSFVVHQYQLEPVRLAVDVPRSVYYRGEEITGKITAKFYYGAPLAGREIRYQLAGGKLETATTDAKGEVAIKFATREFRESQMLPLIVQLPERNLAIQHNLYLSTQGFSLAVSTIRPVYLAGETFEATIKCTSPESKPVGTKLVLKVLQQTKVDGRVGERLVQELPLATADKDGQVRQTLKLADGGTYILRAEATDQFKNPISAAASVQLSDDKDSVRLRLLADTHTFKAGDAAKVNLHWREKPALALVTYQGARVLGYKLVELKTGDNALEVPMTPELAPNFELAVAVMTDPRNAPAPKAGESPKPVTRLHTTASPFTVQRDLRIALEVRRKGGAKGPARPGEEVEVVVKTTDPQGRPITAELSLAMIEQALLERFSFSVPGIDDFFRGAARQTAVRTTSSIVFEYRPATQAINPRLLAEEDRKELEEREKELLSRVAAGEAKMVTLHMGDSVRVVEEFAVPALRGRLAPAKDEPATEAAAAQFDSDATDLMKDEVDDLKAGVSGRLSGKGRADGRTWSAGGGGQGRGEGDRGGFGYAARGINRNKVGVAVNGQAAATHEFGVMFSDSEQAGAQIAGGDKQAWVKFQGKEAEYFGRMLERNQRDVAVLGKAGGVHYLNLGDLSDDFKRNDAAKKLADAGAAMLPNLGPQDTGYWNPAITTDAKGEAIIAVTLPERSTAWKLLAKGITAQTLAGEATGEVVAQKELFAEVKLPNSFTDGDEAQFVVSVHNQQLDKGQIKVTLKTTIGGKPYAETKTLDVTAKGITELVFTRTVKLPEGREAGKPAAMDVEVAVSVADAPAASDVVRRVVPIQPYGLEVFATASGAASNDTTAWVDTPAGVADAARTLQVIVGPSIEKSLTDVLLGPAPMCQVQNVRIASGLDTATSDIMAALALQRLESRAPQAAGLKPQASLQAFDARVRSSVSLLVSSQNDDGGWSWTGRGGASNRYSSARVIWALALAKQAGYSVPTDGYEKAITFLTAQVAATSEADYESKAILLHALSAAGRGDFALANRLHRNRPALSAGALAHLALAFVNMDRKPMADDVLKLLAERNLDIVPLSRKAAGGVLPWTHASAELRALYALALQGVSPTSPKAKEMIDWLLAHRSGHRWSPDKATGPAMLALGEWFSKNRFEVERYSLDVYVNDIKVKTLDIDAATPTQTIDVLAAALKPGRQRINLAIKGRGRFTYQCILGGFVAAERVAGTTKDWQVSRIYEPAPQELDGQEIPRGFDVVQAPYQPFRNVLAQLPIGRRGHVELHVTRMYAGAFPDEQHEYLVITEPLPSGVTVIENSVRGGFERFEISPGAITFYVGSRRYVEAIHYDVHGYLAGKYRSGPTVVRNAYRPDQIAVSKTKELTVLALGGKSSDTYQLSPKELFELGKRHFEKRRYEQAGTHLAELMAKWTLNPEPYKEAARMLLDIHLEKGPPAQVVRYFEIIKEKWPELEVPFEKIMKVGTAYHEMGEYERSYLIFRATVESSFSRENGVAGFLDSQGEFLRSVDVMERLLRDYPAESYTAAASYYLAQQVYAKAEKAAADAKLREKKVHRVDLIRQAHRMLEDFLTVNPQDPAADQASFSAAYALLELKAFKAAIAACERYAKRYPKSDYLDSYWYLIGYCHFALNDHQAALEMCRRVAEAKRTDKATGREVEAQNKWQAIYILGQIHHSLGQAAEAIREYARVKDRFADAAQAIAYFDRKEIKLPEVTTLRPTEKAEVKLSFRNVAGCDVRVYRIDLMKFSLLHRNLAGITGINLAGIRPFHEAQIKLGDGKDYRDREHAIGLPLKEEGAYLVVCRGDDLHTSGLVLLTPLAIEVQEEAPSGRVRTTIKDRTSDKYVTNVHVKTIGSRNQDFVSGATDLRGVFVADGIAGKSTVIAQLDARRYAFHRGSAELGPPPAPPAPKLAAPNAPAQDPAKPGQSAGKGGELLENLRQDNFMILQQQEGNLKQLYQQQRKGVEVREAY